MTTILTHDCSLRRRPSPRQTTSIKTKAKARLPKSGLERPSQLSPSPGLEITCLVRGASFVLLLCVVTSRCSGLCVLFDSVSQSDGVGASCREWLFDKQCKHTQIVVCMLAEPHNSVTGWRCCTRWLCPPCHCHVYWRINACVFFNKLELSWVEYSATLDSRTYCGSRRYIHSQLSMNLLTLLSLFGHSFTISQYGWNCCWTYKLINHSYSFDSWIDE